jgi:type II secretory pathway pseudopilin PulG
MRTRRGHSLVECLIAISLIGATLSIVAVAMNQIRRTCRRVSEVSTVELELQRFAAQLRADAHQALSVEQTGANDANAAGGTLLLSLAGERSVKYTLRATHVERLLHRGDELRQRETYGLPKSVTAAWQVQTDRSLPLVSLKLEPGPVESGRPQGIQSIQINAAVGLFPALLSSDES